MSAVLEQTVVQGRFGFYPCDRETYFKIKELNFLSYLNLRMDKAYARWANKEPQNRIAHRWVRNAQGQKVQSVAGDPIAEPRKGLAAFNEKVKTGTYSYKTIRQLLESDYRNARYPKTKAEEVTSLVLPIDRIDQLLVEARAWLSQ